MIFMKVRTDTRVIIAFPRVGIISLSVIGIYSNNNNLSALAEE